LITSTNDENNKESIHQTNDLAQRSDILFIYDSRMANPNGDPDDNRPRIDPYSRVNLVTDYRLKRTIRDYILNYYGNESPHNPNKIFMRQVFDNEKNIKGIEDLAIDFIDKEILKDDEGTQKTIKVVREKDILKNYIDVRLFGLMFLVSGISFKTLGPVQFSIGTSLNIPEEILIRNTRIIPTKKKAKSGTFGEKSILKYSLILFHGFINQIAAKKTLLTEDDIMKMMIGMWYGTNDLSTSSKYGQTSRFMLRIIYSDENGYIGDLDRNITLKNDSKENIEDISQAQVNMTDLFIKLAKNKKIIKELQFACYPDLNIFINGEEKDLKEYIEEWSKTNEIKCLNILTRQEIVKNNSNPSHGL
jgi:CRISPR-associated protein Csh2